MEMTVKERKSVKILPLMGLPLGILVLMEMMVIPLFIVVVKILMGLLLLK